MTTVIELEAQAKEFVDFVLRHTQPERLQANGKDVTQSIILNHPFTKAHGSFLHCFKNNGGKAHPSSEQLMDGDSLIVQRVSDKKFLISRIGVEAKIVGRVEREAFNVWTAYHTDFMSKSYNTTPMQAIGFILAYEGQL